MFLTELKPILMSADCESSGSELFVDIIAKIHNMKLHVVTILMTVI